MLTQRSGSSFVAKSYAIDDFSESGQFYVLSQTSCPTSTSVPGLGPLEEAGQALVANPSAAAYLGGAGSTSQSLCRRDRQGVLEESP